MLICASYMCTSDACTNDEFTNEAFTNEASVARMPVRRSAAGCLTGTAVVELAPSASDSVGYSHERVSSSSDTAKLSIALSM